MLRFTPLLLLMTSVEGSPLPTEPPSVVFQDLLVAPVAGFYPQVEGDPGSVLPYPDQFYLMPVSVGTPAQLFNLTFDSVWNEVVLLAAELGADGSCNVSYAQPMRNLYNSSASSTYRPTDVKTSPVFSELSIYENPKCRTNFGYTSTLIHDNLRIGPFDMGDALYDLASTIHGAFTSNWNSDGIFPFFPSDYAFVWQIPEPTISVFVNRVDPTSEGQARIGGRLVIGGQDTVNCENKWTPSGTKVPYNGTLFFGFNKFSIGKRQLKLNATGELQATTSYIYAPPNVVDVVVTTVDAEYDYASGSYFVDCEKRKSFPSIVLQLNGGFQYRIPSEDYTKKITTTSGKRCTLMFRECATSCCLRDGIWTIGTSFNRPYCNRIHFYKEHVELEFALVKN